VQFALTVPTIRDRVVQTAAKLLLEPQNDDLGFEMPPFEQRWFPLRHDPPKATKRFNRVCNTTLSPSSDT
jgi:hypothetical protein